MSRAPDLQHLTQRLLQGRFLFEHPDSYEAGVLDTVEAVEALLRAPAHDTVVAIDQQIVAVR